MPPICANIRSRKFTEERCKYVVSKGEFCHRHWKNPIRFEAKTHVTRSTHMYAKKIQRWWKLRYGLYLFKLKSPAFFSRNICHNDTELASFEPLSDVKRDYFFAIKENTKYWGFDIRSLLVNYNMTGHLENPYTKVVCDTDTINKFRLQVDTLRRWKKSIQFEETTSLTVNQSWNLRVLDICLRLDMLGYRIATQWFTELDIVLQRRLYSNLFDLWNEQLELTIDQKERIVPGNSIGDTKLFKWIPLKITMKSDLDSVRRTNINVMERLISSAELQSDRTLGAMYIVMSLCRVSNQCRIAYPWLQI